VSGEAAYGQPVEEDVVDVAVLLDPRVTDLDITASSAAFFSEGVGGVRWWFFGHAFEPPKDAVNDGCRSRLGTPWLNRDQQFHSIPKDGAKAGFRS
jgi:hypothetical protein